MPIISDLPVHFENGRTSTKKRSFSRLFPIKIVLNSPFDLRRMIIILKLDRSIFSNYPSDDDWWGDGEQEPTK